MSPAQILGLTRDGRVLIDASGHPCALRGEYPAHRLVRIGPTTRAIRLTEEEASREMADAGLAAASVRAMLGDRRVAKALALLDNLERLKFDPADGSPIAFDEDGRVGRGASGRMIFPRTDPAVIALIRLAGSEQVLIARNARASFYSLVAGFVDPGESLEEAVEREALEETGRRVHDIAYWGSQPWPPGGSLMMGFTALTSDEHPVADTDGELADAVWVVSDTITDYPLAPEGSIARDMLGQWYLAQTGKALHST